MRWIAIFTTLALVPALARPKNRKRAQAGAGVDMVEAQCGACHSLRFILMNSPFLGPAQWDAEVAKNDQAFGGADRTGDAKTIGDYLKENYGG